MQELGVLQRLHQTSYVEESGMQLIVGNNSYTELGLFDSVCFR